MANIWDNVADKFNTYKEEVWYGAADNIDTVWPVILDYVKKQFPNPQRKRALEFGCGTGMFCRELSKLGFDVTGIDVSEEMIKIGKENLDTTIKLGVGDIKTTQEVANKNGQFDLITAIMVLQFIQSEKLTELVNIIAPKGHLIFATHSPAQLDQKGVTDTFTLSDTQVSIPIYKRASAEYDKIFLALGFVKTLEEYVQASKEFLEKYQIVRNMDIPKYMILGYQKS